MNNLWLNGGSRSQDILPSAIEITLLTLNLPLALLKHIVHGRIAHSSIPSHRNYFITLTRGILVSYIATTSNQYWWDSHNATHFFFPPTLINSSMSPLTNLIITKSFDTYDWTDACPLTNLYATAHGINMHNQKRTCIMSYDSSWQFHVTPFKYIYTTYTYMPNSFHPRLPKNTLSTYILFSTHISFFSHIYGIPNYFIFFLL